MGDEVIEEERRDRISAVFALLTAKLEDAATLASDCQGQRPEHKLLSSARQIADLAGEVATIAGALVTLLHPLGGEPPE